MCTQSLHNAIRRLSITRVSETKGTNKRGRERRQPKLHDAEFLRKLDVHLCELSHTTYADNRPKKNTPFEFHSPDAISLFFVLPDLLKKRDGRFKRLDNAPNRKKRDVMTKHFAVRATATAGRVVKRET